MSEVLLSIVVPAYEEAASLPLLLDRLTTVLQPVTEQYEIIVIDDGSRDATFLVASDRHARDPRIKALRFSRNFGKEAALVAGLERSRGQAVITLDADLQHPPELIPQLVARWREGAQIVHAVKQDRQVDGRLRAGAAALFNRLLSRLAGFDMLGACDYKLLDARVVKLLVQSFPERVRFYRGLSTWVGYTQATVRFTVQPRAAGLSRWGVIGLARYGWRAITAFSALPLQVVPLLGVLMLAVAILLGAEAIVSRLAGSAVSGFATLEITILFTGSLVMIGLGVIGQYLARIYEELKRRPVYLTDREVGFDQGDQRGS